MQCIYKDYPDRIVYVMSDLDGYYENRALCVKALSLK